MAWDLGKLPLLKEKDSNNEIVDFVGRLASARHDGGLAFGATKKVPNVELTWLLSIPRLMISDNVFQLGHAWTGSPCGHNFLPQLLVLTSLRVDELHFVDFLPRRAFIRARWFDTGELIEIS